VNRIDNATGRSTYDDWCKPGRSSNTRESFESDIGSGITRPIKLIASEDAIDPADSAEPRTSAAIEDEPYDEYSEPYVEQPTSEPNPHIVNQTINAPAVFFNSGANVMQINNTGTINIDRGGKV
jgi:hypothetical protein